MNGTVWMRVLQLLDERQVAGIIVRASIGADAVDRADVWAPLPVSRWQALVPLQQEKLVPHEEIAPRRIELWSVSSRIALYHIRSAATLANSKRNSAFSLNESK